MYYTHAPVDTLTPEQAAKRVRAMDATLQLARDHGLAALTMKAVAAASGVALGTLYRFFVTKDHMLAASFLHWALPIHASMANHGKAAGSGRQELAAMFQRGSYVYREQPTMLAMLVYVFTSTDDHAAAETQKLRDFLNEAMRPLLGAPDAAALTRSEILVAVWLDALMATRRGTQSLEKGVEQLAAAVELLVPSNAG
jgi:AcrR family transcriptional regulator